MALEGVTGREFLEMRRLSGPILSERDCVEIDALNALDLPPEIP
jgi:hypothetical protein